MKKLFKRIKKCGIIFTFMMFIMIMTGFSSEDKKVFDEAQLLSEEEENKLQQMCIDKGYENEADIIILTVDGLDGKNIRDYSDDYYDNNGFGYEKEMGTGIILVVAMDTREVAISTSGKCVELLSKSQTDEMIDNMTAYLSSGDYYNAFKTYIDDFDKEYNYSKANISKKRLIKNLAEIAVAMVIGGIVTAVIYGNHSTKMTVNGYTYSKNHTCDIINKNDIYRRTATTVRHIERNNSNEGSGSNFGVHTASSGNRHGGSSGSF